jgi:hypothetical protein
MPSYDIIPLASDLLEYTIQRVKQKDPEYRRTKAYVMENGQMVEKTLYEKVQDVGKPHFPKSQAFHLCAELQGCAIRILKGCVDFSRNTGTNTAHRRAGSSRQMCGTFSPP